MSCCPIQHISAQQSGFSTKLNTAENWKIVKTAKETINNYSLIFFTIKEFNDNARFFNSAGQVMSGVSKNTWTIDLLGVFDIERSFVSPTIDKKLAELIITINKNKLELQRLQKLQSDIINTNTNDRGKSQPANTYSSDRIKALKSEIDLHTLMYHGIKNASDSEKFRSGQINKNISLTSPRSRKINDFINLLQTDTGYTPQPHSSAIQSLGLKLAKKYLKKEDDTGFQLQMTNSFDHQEFWYNFTPYIKNQDDNFFKKLKALIDPNIIRTNQSYKLNYEVRNTSLFNTRCFVPDGKTNYYTLSSSNVGEIMFPTILEPTTPVPATAVVTSPPKTSSGDPNVQRPLYEAAIKKQIREGHEDVAKVLIDSTKNIFPEFDFENFKQEVANESK
jgi:hypothetical protein